MRELGIRENLEWDNLECEILESERNYTYVHPLSALSAHQHDSSGCRVVAVWLLGNNLQEDSRIVYSLSALSAYQLGSWLFFKVLSALVVRRKQTTNMTLASVLLQCCCRDIICSKIAEAYVHCLLSQPDSGWNHLYMYLERSWENLESERTTFMCIHCLLSQHTNTTRGKPTF